jgi:alpha-L-fucosidase
VTILVDIVSRGGNLLLDIGPGADGTIPVIMEQRLAEIGGWLTVNGEAIYGTKPFATPKQWSDGAVPKVDYGQEYNADYDVSKLTQKQPPGKASIEAFFTAKGNDLYAILPRWPGRRFVLKDAAAKGVKAVNLLGSAAPLKVSPSGANLAVELPDLPEDLLGQPAWVLKIAR